VLNFIDESREIIYRRKTSEDISLDLFCSVRVQMILCALRSNLEQQYFITAIEIYHIGFQRSGLEDFTLLNLYYYKIWPKSKKCSLFITFTYH
jgi:hypothetical protein